MWWWSRLPESMKLVKPFTNLVELRLEFLFHCGRHSSRLREEAEHVGIALLGTRKGPFGVFPMAHAVRCFSNGGEREAHPQVRPDEINACLVDFIPKSQWNRFAHVTILRDIRTAGAIPNSLSRYWSGRMPSVAAQLPIWDCSDLDNHPD